MTDRYFMDYRKKQIVKNLDTSFLAPEYYNEIIIDESLDGSYIYTYEDVEGKQLRMAFTQEELESVDFHTFKDRFCRSHDFVPEYIVDKKLYLNRENFDKLVAYQGGIS